MHKSVLLDSVLSHLNLLPGQIVLDATVGSGGHSETILRRISPNGLLIGLDQDEEALKRAEARLKSVGGKFILKRINFRYLDQTLSLLNIPEVHAVLLDVGISSDQLEAPDRGFSFMREGPLDMRMDQGQDQTAEQLIYGLSEKELVEVFSELGEERFARRIAHKIVSERARKPIKTTFDLKQVVEEVVPSQYRFGRIHPATRIFQALRIAVNDELNALKEALPKAFHSLERGGRLAVISFHSLEDRIVKQYFVKEKNAGAGKIITKKPIEADEIEIKENSRSRSAKLRVIERINRHSVSKGLS